LKSALIVALALLTFAGSPVWAGDFRVTLLGTGTPTPRADRYGQSTLIEAGQQKLLFDLGRGVTIRLWRTGIPLGSVTAHSRAMTKETCLGVVGVALGVAAALSLPARAGRSAQAGVRAAITCPASGISAPPSRVV
jgi:hypothetical protein